MAIQRLPSTGDKPRNTGIPESLVPGGDGDSAGFPWEGRTFAHHDTAFADDDGRTPEEYLVGLMRMREAAAALGSAPDQVRAIAELGATRADWLTMLSNIRLLIPLVADAGELGQTPDGRIVEKTQELSIVTVAAPDGRTAMPVFTSTDAMQAWDPEARPIPVPAPQAAIAAAQEHTDLIIIDPASEATRAGVRRPELRGIAMGEAMLPAWADVDVRTAFLDASAGEPQLRALALIPGDAAGELEHAETEVRLLVAPGLHRDDLALLTQRLQDRWSRHPLIAERVDSLRVVPQTAPE